MWGYQSHFRFALSYQAEQVMDYLGVDTEIDVFLVGLVRPSESSPNPVCIEPEEGKWPLEIFFNLKEKVEEAYSVSPLHNMFYGHEQSMRDKPENIRRAAVASEVANSLEVFNEEHCVYSFCGLACPVGDFHVVPVLQVSRQIFKKFPPIQKDSGGTNTPTASFLHSIIGVILEDAAVVLQQPEPGRETLPYRKPQEVARIAAERFMLTPEIAAGPGYAGNLFETFNVISSLLYERAKGRGFLILSSSANPAIDYALRLVEPVPLRDHRWARKMLQMAEGQLGLIADSHKIHGLGVLNSNYDSKKQDAYVIDFTDHYKWQIRSGEQVLLRSQYGEPDLPQERISYEKFADNLSRIFSKTDAQDHRQLWSIFQIVQTLEQGCMIMVADDAASEAKRLALQGTVIQPTLLTEDLLRRVSKIDGTILLDPQCVCYAVGVILDGPANSHCTPSRGSRYNSAIRYVYANECQRFVIVASEDNTIDLVPLLRERISRAQVEENIVELERSNCDNYHSSRNWLDEHRFYIGPNECERINKALERLNSLQREVGHIFILTVEFVPSLEMNETYYVIE